MVNSIAVPFVIFRSEARSGEAWWVGPMMKFPSASAGGMSPSGSSFALTYPGVCGSRAGGVGRVVCEEISGTATAAAPATKVTSQAVFRERAKEAISLFRISQEQESNTAFPRLGGRELLLV